MENKRYKELEKKIQKYLKEGNDVNLLRSLYSQVNLKESELVDRSEDIKNETMFSGLTDKELLERYEKKFFNRYTNREIKHLFQESHNRYIKESGLEVTRNVVVKVDSKNPNFMGYVQAGQDLLFMNKGFINSSKQVKDDNQLMNEKTIGKVMLSTLLHETKHNIQYEDAIDFALGNEQEVDRAFSGACMIINNTNFNVAWEESEKEYERYVAHWRENYDYHVYEQEANYSANKKMLECYGERDYSNMKMDYAQILALNAIDVFRFRPTDDKKEDERLIKERVQKLEDYTKYQLEYFEKRVKDCPLKTQIVETMHNYIDVDEKGNSLLRTRLTNELNEMYDQYENSAEVVRTYLKAQKKDEEETKGKTM